MIMKCGRKVVYRQYKKRGKSGEFREKPYACIRWSHEDNGVTAESYAQRPGDRIEICDGDVIATVSISGDCPCCDSPEIEIEYKCSKCKNTVFPELGGDLDPRDHLSEILTNALSKMPKKEHKRLIAEKRQKNEEFLQQVIDSELEFAKSRSGPSPDPEKIREDTKQSNKVTSEWQILSPNRG